MRFQADTMMQEIHKPAALLLLMFLKTFKEAVIGNVQYAIYGVIALIAIMAFSAARKI